MTHRSTRANIVRSALVLAGLLPAIAIGPALADAPMKLSKGDVVPLTGAVCESRADADALLAEVQKGGIAKGIEYMDREDNSCGMARIVAIIGEPQGTAVHSPSGEFVVLEISSPAGQRLFTVTRTSTLDYVTT